MVKKKKNRHNFYPHETYVHNLFKIFSYLIVWAICHSYILVCINQSFSVRSKGPSSVGLLLQARECSLSNALLGGREGYQDPSSLIAAWALPCVKKTIHFTADKNALF